MAKSKILIQLVNNEIALDVVEKLNKAICDTLNVVDKKIQQLIEEYEVEAQYDVDAIYSVIKQLKERADFAFKRASCGLSFKHEDEF